MFDIKPEQFKEWAPPPPWIPAVEDYKTRTAHAKGDRNRPPELLTLP